jgi:hypothetical protein
MKPKKNNLKYTNSKYNNLEDNKFFYKKRMYRGDYIIFGVILCVCAFICCYISHFDVVLNADNIPKNIPDAVLTDKEIRKCLIEESVRYYHFGMPDYVRSKVHQICTVEQFVKRFFIPAHYLFLQQVFKQFPMNLPHSQSLIRFFL